MNLYLLKYNNYYNRIVKKENSLNNYLQYQVGDVLMNVINWNPRDYVNTEQLINNWTYETPDYLIAVTDNNQIDSRWFVIEAEYQRNGQYKLTLHRDLVVDYYDETIKAPCFIEKATLDYNDPFIFNKEDMTFNQIKTSETLLKDFSGCPWLVGYIARKNSEGNTITYSGKVDVAISPDIFVNGPLSNFEYYDYINKSISYTNNYDISIRFDVLRKEIIDGIYTETIVSRGKSTLNMPSEVTTFNSSVDESFGTIYFYYEDNIDENAAKQAFINNKDTINNYFNAYYNLESDRTLINNLWNLNGKVISYIEDNKQVKKRIRVYNSSAQTFNNSPITSAAGGLYTTLQSVATQSNMLGQGTSQSFVATFDKLGLTVELLNEDIDKSINYNIPITRCFTTDAPYDVFAIPYADGLTLKNVKNASGSYQDVTVYSDNALSFASGLITNETTGSIYDVQILPYCPISGIFNNDGALDLANLQNTDNLVIYTNLTTDSGDIISPIFFASRSSFTLDILLNEPIVITNPKLQNECDMYRLCSPNYAGTFEFNAAKNGGVRSFNIDCTYLPYNPYIHVNPDFGNLYGQDFNDSRGLICNGDFSIANTSSAWATYQLNNKNYQASFNRQIQNMEVNNNVQRTMEIWSAATGALSAAGTGAAAGMLVGGPAGAAAGAIGGGILSAAGGIADVYYNDKLRNEALDYTKDQFGYQLGNIKAIPQSLSRTTAFTYNNKYFPILEYYTCTDEEKQALLDKIKYDGMTVMRIGKIRDFIKQDKSYIKGKLIRTEDITDDYHLVKALADEIYKGVFI